MPTDAVADEMSSSPEDLLSLWWSLVRAISAPRRELLDEGNPHADETERLYMSCKKELIKRKIKIPTLAASHV